MINTYLFQKGTPKKKKPAGSLKRSKWCLGLPIHIKILLIITLEYWEFVLNKPFIKVYYIELPIRIRVFQMKYVFFCYINLLHRTGRSNSVGRISLLCRPLCERVRRTVPTLWPQSTSPYRAYLWGEFSRKYAKSEIPNNSPIPFFTIYLAILYIGLDV